MDSLLHMLEVRTIAVLCVPKQIVGKNWSNRMPNAAKDPEFLQKKQNRRIDEN